MSDTTQDIEHSISLEESSTSTDAELVPTAAQELAVALDSAMGSLDPDLIDKILGMLEISDLRNAMLVSQEWYTMARSEALWKRLYEEREWTVALPEGDIENCDWYDLYRLHLEKEQASNGGEEETTAPKEAPDDQEQMLTLPEPATLDTVSLRRLLETEEFVMALQNGEDAVLTFLETPETIVVMMNLLFNEQHLENDMQSQRIVHITIQTLVSGIITDVFIMNTDLMHELFDHLAAVDMSLEGARARCNCIAKIISILFEKFTTQMISFFQTRQSFIASLLCHTQDPDLMEILYKFVDCDLTHQWLYESELITHLVSLLHHEEPLEIQESAAGVLVNILSLCQAWPQSVLISDMLNNELITGSIVSFMENKPANGESIKLYLRVLIGILSLISDELEDPPVVVTLLANSIELFSAILEDPAEMDSSEGFKTTTGEITRGFGFVRLGVLELLVSLLYTGFPIVVEFMLERRVFTIILDLLFEYPWNNIIHNQISQLFSGLFCCNNPEIIQAVMTDSRLPERIVEAHQDSESNSAGYLGHLRELANELVRAGKMSEPIGSYLNTKTVWQEFVEGDLKQFNLTECVVPDEYLEYENQFFQEAYDEYEIVESDDFNTMQELEGSYDDYQIQEMDEEDGEDEGAQDEY